VFVLSVFDVFVVVVDLYGNQNADNYQKDFSKRIGKVFLYPIFVKGGILWHTSTIGEAAVQFGWIF
jgi:hypothetical protein